MNQQLNVTDKRAVLPDIDVENHGTIILFRPNTEAAFETLREIVAPDAQWFGNALAVEPRYAESLAQGLQNEGLAVG